jgi:hypothetical protein
LLSKQAPALLKALDDKKARAQLVFPGPRPGLPIANQAPADSALTSARR